MARSPPPRPHGRSPLDVKARPEPHRRGVFIRAARLRVTVSEGKLQPQSRRQQSFRFSPPSSITPPCTSTESRAVEFSLLFSHLNSVSPVCFSPFLSSLRKLSAFFSPPLVSHRPCFHSRFLIESLRLFVFSGKHASQFLCFT